MTDLPTPNTETGHTGWKQASVASCPEPTACFEIKIENHGGYHVATVYGQSYDQCVSRARFLVNACASIQGDPGEGIRKAIEALEDAMEVSGSYMDRADMFGLDNLVSELLTKRRKYAAALSALKGGEV